MYVNIIHTAVLPHKLICANPEVHNTLYCCCTCKWSKVIHTQRLFLIYTKYLVVVSNSQMLPSTANNTQHTLLGWCYSSDRLALLHPLCVTTVCSVYPYRCLTVIPSFISRRWCFACGQSATRKDCLHTWFS